LCRWGRDSPPELLGVTLADCPPRTTHVCGDARGHFEQHSVLVFRGQEVTDEIQIAFSRRFGRRQVNKVGSQARARSS